MTTTEQTTQTRGRGALPDDGGRRTAVLGLGLVALAPLVIVAVDPGAAPFVLPITVLAGLGAGLAWRFGTWASGVAAALGLVALIGVGGGPASIGVRRPDSVFDFVPAWMIVMGGLLAIVGGAVAIVGVRRGVSGPSLAPLRRGALALLGIAALASAALSLTTGDRLTDAELAGTQLVVLDEATFTPDTLELRAGEEHRLALRNEGAIIHTFTSPALGVDVELAPGDEALVVVAPADADQVAFWCTPHSEETADGDREGMAGVLTVTP